MLINFLYSEYIFFPFEIQPIVTESLLLFRPLQDLSTLKSSTSLIKILSPPSFTEILIY